MPSSNCAQRLNVQALPSHVGEHSRQRARALKGTNRNLIASLSDLLKGRICIVGVGNRQRGDDGAGPRVIDARDPTAGGFWLDAGVAPENYLEPIARWKPDTILIVDVVAFGGDPGECQLIDPKTTETTSVSTHAGSLDTLCRYLSNRTGAQIKVLAIQPESIDLVNRLSPPVEDAVIALAQTLSSLLSRNQDQA